MARARNIKPGFFKNEHLCSLPPLTRLLFEALWCEADLHGRLEDRPLRLKAEYFAYDDYDVDTGLAQLQHSAGTFITRYEVDGVRYIQVINFKKHQNPHKAEKSRGFPPPPEPSEIKQVFHSTIPAQCKHRACMILARLIPDSLNLIPDILITDKAAAISPVKVLAREDTTPPAEESKPGNEDENPEKRLLVADVQELAAKYLGQLVTKPGEVTVIQGLIAKYPAKRIMTAFEAAGAAGAHSLLWVVKRLGDPIGGRSRASPGHGMSAAEVEAENRRVAREFCGVEP